MKKRILKFMQWIFHCDSCELVADSTGIRKDMIKRGPKYFPPHRKYRKRR